MDLFDVHRRDVLNFDSYMDLKNPGFGGDASLIYDRDAKGKKNKNKQSENKLKDYQRVVERDPLFKSQHYNSTYKAMSNDLVYKQAGKKPTTYADPYITGLPVIEVDESVNTSFKNFINEDSKVVGSIKSTVDINDNVKKELSRDEEILKKLKKQKDNILTEGKCCNFNQFNSIDENWYDEYETEILDPEPDVAEPEIEIDTEEGPENPPKRRNNPNPKNKFSKKSNDLSSLGDLLDFGEGPDGESCYGEGPGAC